MSRAGADGVAASAAGCWGAPWTDAAGLDASWPDAFGAVATLLVACAGFASGGGGNSAWYP